MEGSTLVARQPDEKELNIREWHLRARISRDNVSSRRFSGSYIRSFREDSRSFRSNFTISSTASSPGYHLKDEIDPSTYSFTTALKALQARSGYVWECLSPEGLALNSKWDEAEKYICNPLSGEVPLECLSAKTLSGRSFRSHMASRVTMSAPLIYSAHHRRSFNQPASKPSVSSIAVLKEKEEEKQTMGSRTQSNTNTPPNKEESSSSSCSPSPTSTPSIQERPRKRYDESEDVDTQNSSSSTKLEPVEECMTQVEVKVTREGEETKRSKEAGNSKQEKTKKKKTGQLCICRQSSGCLLLSWSSLCMNKRKREKQKPISE